MQAKLDKLEAILHSLNSEQREGDEAKYTIYHLSNNYYVIYRSAGVTEVNMDEYTIVKSLLSYLHFHFYIRTGYCVVVELKFLVKTK